jgi:hypothetical protein
MAYFNPVTNDALVKERQQAFQRAADRRRLVRIADASQSRPQTNVLAALQKRIIKGIQLQRPAVEASCKA